MLKKGSVCSLKRWNKDEEKSKAGKWLFWEWQLDNHHDNDTVIAFDLIFVLVTLFFVTYILYFLLILWVYIYFISFAFYITSSFQFLDVQTGVAVLQVRRAVDNAY